MVRLADLHMCINFFDVAHSWSCYIKGPICCWNLWRILWKVCYITSNSYSRFSLSQHWQFSEIILGYFGGETEGSIPFSQSKVTTTCFWTAPGRGDGQGRTGEGRWAREGIYCFTKQNFHGLFRRISCMIFTYSSCKEISLRSHIVHFRPCNAFASHVASSTLASFLDYFLRSPNRSSHSIMPYGWLIRCTTTYNVYEFL